jgi:hypothetical protein
LKGALLTDLAGKSGETSNLRHANVKKVGKLGGNGPIDKPKFGLFFTEVHWPDPLPSRHTMDRIKLIKLMYFVDRQAFLAYGATISGDRMVSLPRGPVLFETLNTLKGATAYSKEFTKWVVTPQEGYSYSLAAGADPDDADLLSDADMEIIENVWDQFGKLDGFALGEWENPGKSSIPISLEKLAIALGMSNEEASQLVLENDEAEGIRQTLASL